MSAQCLTIHRIVVTARSGSYPKIHVVASVVLGCVPAYTANTPWASGDPPGP
jgi:hypothetical protein